MKHRTLLGWPAVLAAAWFAWPVFAATGAPVVTQAWARATPPGLTVGAAYLTITGGTQADRLIGASSPRAAMVQIHTTESSNGVAGMREVASLDVPAGAKVSLAPNGTHLMLMGLDGPLVAGQELRLTLRFERAGPVEVIAKVRRADDPGSRTH